MHYDATEYPVLGWLVAKQGAAAGQSAPVPDRRPRATHPDQHSSRSKFPFAWRLTILGDRERDPPHSTVLWHPEKVIADTSFSRSHSLSRGQRKVLMPKASSYFILYHCWPVSFSSESSE